VLITVPVTGSIIIIVKGFPVGIPIATAILTLSILHLTVNTFEYDEDVRKK
jgi:hypothetical protein